MMINEFYRKFKFEYKISNKIIFLAGFTLFSFFNFLFILLAEYEHFAFLILGLCIINILFTQIFIMPAIIINDAKLIKKNIKTVGVSNKHYTKTLILTIFLGFFGIHRFYLGKKLSGVLYLLNAILFIMVGFGFPFLWIIDLFILLLGLFDDKDNKRVINPKRNVSNCEQNKIINKDYSNFMSELNDLF